MPRRTLVFFHGLALAMAALDARSAAETLLPAYRLASGESLAADDSSPGAADPLAAAVVSFRAAQTPISAAFLVLGRSYGITFVLDPELRGDVSLEVRDGTVRDVVDALAASRGLYWERQGRMIAVRRSVMRFYEIDYPQMTRSAQGASNVVLSAQSTVTSTGATSTALNGTPGAPANDQTNISIQQQNQTTFWADVQAELAQMAQPGEAVVVNKLAGLAVVTASPSRQGEFKALIDALNRRISQQVRISARVLEVDLSSDSQLGVDWSLAATKVGGVALTGLATGTAFSTLNGQTLGPSTVTGTLSTGKISAVISALREQGEVRAVSNPSVVSLSNQTAFVKVGTEQTFFSRASSTTVNQAGATAPFSTTQSSYTQNAITIGTVLYVTPEVNRDGTVTVDVLPAITQLIGVDTSPDGEQTAPRMDIKSLSTIARLHPGESVMIGGLIRDETDRSGRKVPLLGDLPLIGGAFGTSATATSRSELVIFLTAERLP
jgi:MSHA biogenesis protein MshL